MKRALLLLIPVVLLQACTAMAQKLEVSPFIGYTTKARISGDGTIVPGDLLIEDSFTAGVGLGMTTPQHVGFEAMYTYQNSSITFDPTVVVGQPSTQKDLGGLGVHLIHANFLFYQARMDAITEPYFLLGLGAIILDPSASGYQTETKFTWAIGLGVKHWVNDKMGIRLQVRYEPTYINATNSGYWCDPYYGCYTQQDWNYLNQFDFTGGVCIKLGH